ncbi:MAG: flagellar filament capping protein FliD [Pseudobdellovibrionaceae bacterium]
MAGIRLMGMASGLPPNIVEQIMEAERIPIKTMEASKTKQEDKLKLVGDLETKINDINKQLAEVTAAGGFLDKKLISGDPSIIDGVIDPATALPGEYQVEVLQLAQKPGALSNGFKDRDETEVGVGYIKFQTTDGMKEVYISGKDSTLDGVARQINNASVGVRAQVLNDRRDKESPYRLLVTGLKTGDDKQVNFPTIYMLDGDQDLFFDQSKAAINAKIKVDGFEIEIPENQSPDIVPGVNLDLKQAAPGRPIRLTVKENLEVISGKVKSFVDSYNAALSFIQDQNKLRQTGKTQGLGPLGGDGMLRSVESALRRIIQNPQYGIESNITLVNQLGIEFNRNGTLTFNADRFNKTLNTNPKAVANFLRGDGFSVGFIPTMKRELQNLTNINFGTVGMRKKGLQDRINQVNTRIESKEKQLEKKEESLRTKFANLEQKMSEIKSQGAAVGAMGGGGGG